MISSSENLPNTSLSRDLVKPGDWSVVDIVKGSVADEVGSVPSPVQISSGQYESSRVQRLARSIRRREQRASSPSGDVMLQMMDAWMMVARMMLGDEKKRNAVESLTFDLDHGPSLLSRRRETRGRCFSREQEK